MKDFKLPTAYFPIEEGELLPKYFSRTSANAEHDILTAAWYAPSGLDRYIKPFQDIIGTFDDLIGQNTFLPLKLRTTTPKQTEMIVKHTRNQYAGGILAPLGMNGLNSAGFRVLPTMCPECAQTNIASCDTPFWNRANMVPGLLFCSVHERPLEVGCNECAVIQDHNKLIWPGQHCGCGLKPLDEVFGMSSAQQEHEMELHRVSKLLLDPEYMPGFTRDSIVEAVRRRSGELGLLDTAANGTEFANHFFAEHPMRRLLERAGVVSSAGASSNHLSGKLVYLNPLQSAALLMSLFDDWSDVESKVEAINAGETECTPTHKEPPEPKALSPLWVNMKLFVELNLERILKAELSKYIVLHNSMPFLSHSELRKRVGGYGEHLLTKERLRSCGVEPPAVSDDAEKNKAIDRLLSEHIARTAHEQVRTTGRRQVTANRLLRGTVLCRKPEIWHLFPLTNAVLNEFTESRAEWFARAGRLLPKNAASETRAHKRRRTTTPRLRQQPRVSNRNSAAPLVDLISLSDGDHEVSKEPPPVQ
ncbi:hypothetical protein [Burkholderia ubonensis]|uniref:hypothetical protein n=1 Tax=Burkholderia ubonensis TaxID=101571 RepID=UPI000BA66F47|nr:hypothetical protein [Burkholderia ubonensis]PAJ93687.1 hypothetical protein CJO69_15485 [Burkholderia ubonensis]RQP28934.1 hypothetical protein DF155_26220 [Burkholderia ubonensis]RQP31861.1 hypothetical protein DF154_28480 [Burkholderia ubonensis]RQP34368.1 hypothetical protein DF156_27020 [Burkholderia ubonensis]RQP49412.1 hypothetical protein DF144_25175 [Burkholderia ubonensis]